MKTKITTLIFIAIATIGLGSCSKETVDNIGRDAALNIIVTGSWKKATKTVSGSDVPEINVKTELLADDEVINFDKNGSARVLKEGTQVRTYQFAMPEPKEIEFDNIKYAVQENIVQSISTLTLINHTGPVRTEIVFKR